MLSSVAIINCSDDNNNMITPVPVDSSDFRYPLTDGSTWNYTITTSVSDIRPDSMQQYFNNIYPLTMSGTVSILYDTTINSVVTKCFLDEFSSNGTSHANRYYYINNDTALILYSRRQPHPAAGMLPLRMAANIFSERDHNTNESEIFADSQYSTLKYPIVTGTEWSHTISGITTQKKYLGFENITVPSGMISCMKESVNYSYSPTGIFYNYYSKYGLLKSYSFLDDINLASPGGDATVDLTGETVITSYNIP